MDPLAFGDTAPLGVVPPAEWQRSPGSERFENGFVWLLPVSELEFAKANAEGSWSVFADLVELATRCAKRLAIADGGIADGGIADGGTLDGWDECSAAFDLLRSTG